MVDDIEQRIYDLIRPYAGKYLFSNKEVPLSPETDLDADLSIDVLEAEDLMDEFFKAFNVDKGKFSVATYYPDTPVSWNPFKNKDPIPVPDFTIGMLIESAKDGKWLFD